MSRNDMVKDFLNQFDEVRRQIELPKFLEGYHVLSCVYDGLEKSCYMVTDREVDEKYLLKIRKCKNDRNVLGVEHQRICELAQAFPEEYKQSQYWKEGETEYLLKYYIQGMDLEKYQEQNRVLSTREVLRIVIEICKATARLHALTPPVLHRDIKPQNLIIDCSGKVHLIDFETTRTYKENKAKDTVFLERREMQRRSSTDIHRRMSERMYMGSERFWNFYTMKILTVKRKRGWCVEKYKKL